MSINPDKIYVIAEAGTCHASSDHQKRLDRAIQYVWSAVEAGADAIKFQAFSDNPNKDDMFCWIDGDEARARRWAQSCLYQAGWWEVKKEADARNIDLLLSTFEVSTTELNAELGLCATKVASRAAGFLNYFDECPGPLIVSNGMYSVTPGKDIIPMQCEANYPSTSRWDTPGYGFSDHSGSPWRAIDAMCRGCSMVEVHFYVDKSHSGPDFPASLTVDELTLVCEARDALHAM